MLSGNLIRVRVKETGQILELVPDAAYPRLAAGTVEAVVQEEKRELAASLRSAANTAARFIGLK